ncbi:hypothetical protein MUO66_06945, partial [Candidatus Bathyarchaeota archaeon]|nr:hypothetical protein [Candidatus Bathyarchaeota archaeon]
ISTTQRLCSLGFLYQRRLREVFPIAATSNATIRNANPDHKLAMLFYWKNIPFRQLSVCVL